MKVFYTKEIKDIDAQTIKDEGITSIELMERAAISVLYEIMSRWLKNIPIVVFAGPGNNGGDALAVARLLTEQGYHVKTYLFNPVGKLSTDCLRNKTRLEQIPDADFIEIINEFNPPELDEYTLVIDGLFGSGLDKPLSGGFASLVQFINSSGATVVAIDIPSGLLGEDNQLNSNRNIIRATLTLTFQFPKLSFFFPENEKFTGEWKILDIGLSAESIAARHSDIFYVEIEEIKSFLRKRSKFANKGQFGHALLIAGSYGMMGAAVLASKGCMYSGAGMLTLHAPVCGMNIIQTSMPEVIFDADSDDKMITNLPDLSKFNAIAIGPGLKCSIITAQVMKQLLSTLNRPCIIDADGLNLIAANPELLEMIPKNSILTPHIKEFERLFGKCDSGYERLQKAIQAALNYNLIIVLKGAYTQIITHKGVVCFNSTGNPGMATAGSGDVLTGIILGLLSQGHMPEQAAILGVYIHGLAGDIAVEFSSEESITAVNIANHIGSAFKSIKK